MNKEDLEKIINDYSWIKVSRYDEEELKNNDLPVEERHRVLLRHHERETTFLIEKCRELAKELITLKEGFK